MFGIRQSSGFWIVLAAAFALGYVAASLSWDAEAHPGDCRAAMSSDGYNDVPPIVGTESPSTDDNASSDDQAGPSAQ